MSSPAFDTLRLDKPCHDILLLTLDRPEFRNALNTRMADELIAVFSTLHTAHPAARVVVVTGAGERAFCAGADLKERAAMNDVEWEAQHAIFEQAFDLIARTPLPVIAAVNGVALGGGCELALVCDFIIAADTARFGQPEARRGIMPGLGGTQRLARRIGIARAKEWLFTGRTVDAQEAFLAGLVNEFVDWTALHGRAIEVASTIAANAPLALAGMKRAVDEGFNLPLGEALHVELREYGPVARSSDRREGIAAFNERRAPRFEGT